ncbi:MAG: preprotein translocase subunit YajC [Flavobacteriaceae bacterium]|nr:preprotein translocase subunit YajC [Flavobacteriaceae bacterium]
MEQLQSFLPLILLFLVIYLFMIRPNLKKQKQEKKFSSELKKGDKIITTGGMYAKVLELNDDGTCILETAAGKMKFNRSAISMEMSNKLNAPKDVKK